MSVIILFICLNIYIFASLVEASVHLGGKLAFKFTLVELFYETEGEHT